MLYVIVVDASFDTASLSLTNLAMPILIMHTCVHCCSVACYRHLGGDTIQFYYGCLYGDIGREAMVGIKII